MKGGAPSLLDSKQDIQQYKAEKQMLLLFRKKNLASLHEKTKPKSKNEFFLLGEKDAKICNLPT